MGPSGRYSCQKLKSMYTSLSGPRAKRKKRNVRTGETESETTARGESDQRNNNCVENAVRDGEEETENPTVGQVGEEVLRDKNANFVGGALSPTDQKLQNKKSKRFSFSPSLPFFFPVCLHEGSPKGESCERRMTWPLLAVPWKKKYTEIHTKRLRGLPRGEQRLR